MKKLQTSHQISRQVSRQVSRWIFLALVLFGVSAGTALSVFSAEKLPNELEGVGITEHLGAQVDLNLKFRDETGQIVPLRKVFDGRRPVVLLPAYYNCPNLCNFFLNGATDSFKKLEWTAGDQFQLLTFSIDPTESPELALGKKKSHLKALGREEAGKGWHWWVNDVERPAPVDGKIDESTNVRTLANQVGFGYKYDKDQEQYAHSAAMIVLTPEGKISRYLYGIEFQPRDLRLALVEASDRKIGTVMDRILLFCFNYDPTTRKYSLYVTNLVRAGGGLTVLLLGGVLIGAWRRNRRGIG